MPPKKFAPQPIKFVGYLHEVMRVPQDVVGATWGVFTKGHGNYMMFKVVKAPADPNITSEDIQTAVLQGREAIGDLKGVENSLMMKKLFTEPGRTLQSLFQQTLNEVASLDEINEDRRSENLARALNGFTTDGESHGVKNSKYLDVGNPLEDPTSWYLKGAKALKVLPFGQNPLIKTDPHTGKRSSAIQLMVDKSHGTDPNQRGQWTDIKSYQDNEKVEEEHQTYASLAGNLTQLAGYMEQAPARLRFRNNSYRDYMRSAMREMGLNLDKVLGVDKGQLAELVKDPRYRRMTGAFEKELTSKYKALKAQYDAKTLSRADFITANFENTIEDLLSDPDRINRALDQSSGYFEALNPETQETVKQFLRQEEWVIKTSIGYYDPKNGKATLEKWAESGLSPKIDGQDYLTTDSWVRKLIDKEKDFDYTLKEELTSLRAIGDITDVSGREFVTSYMLSDAFNASIRATIIQKIEATKADISTDAYNGLLAHYTPAVARAMADQAADLYVSQKTDETLKRLDSGKNAVDIANNLSNAALTQQLLEAIQEGKFVNTVFITTRLMGEMPFLSKNVRSGQEFMSPFGPPPGGVAVLFPVIAKPYAALKDLSSTVINASGIQFDSKSADLTDIAAFTKKVESIDPITGKKVFKNATNAKGKLFLWLNSKTKIFDSHTILEWEQRDPVTGAPLRKYSFHHIKTIDAAGMYGDLSPYNLIEKLHTKKFGEGMTTFAFDAQKMFSDFTQMDLFYSKLENCKNALASMVTAGQSRTAFNTLSLEEKEFADLLAKLGFLKGDVLDIASLDKAFALKKTFDGNARGLFQKLSGLRRGALIPEQRWEWLRGMAKSGKSVELQSIYTGLLDKWNRYSNSARNYIYKNVIFGRMITDLPIIGNLYKPIQTFIGKLGMADEVSLSQAISNWKLFGKFKGWAAKLTRISVDGAERTAFLASANLLTRMLGNKAFAMTLAKVLGMAVGVLTGYISYVITFVGGTIWKVSKRLFKLDFKGAARDIKDDLISLGNVVKKTVIYPIVIISCIPCGCLFAIIAFLVVIIGGSLAPLEPLGNGLSAQVNSEKITVTKELHQPLYNTCVQGGICFYKITVKNISEDIVTIATAKDTLIMNLGCGAGGTGATLNYDDAGFKGDLVKDATSTTRLPLSAIESEFMDKQIEKGGEITAYYALKGVTTGDATYYNTFEATVKEELGKSAVGSIDAPIGAGGCARCPSGWPVCASSGVCSVSITQGPNTDNTHSHYGVEAVDLGVGVGTPIYASHDGTASIVDGCPANTSYAITLDFRSCAKGYSATPNLCGGCFGNHIILASDMGFRSAYAHLTTIDASVTNGSHVTKGQLIGTTGISGNSGGPHLHYEFMRTNGGYPACNPGQPVRMVQPYVPAF